MLRTHTCGQLTEKDVEEHVMLCGWVHVRRDHGGVIFIDLRDHYGITQIVFHPDCKDFKEAEHLRREDVIQVKGSVVHRKEGMENPKLATGQIEVNVVVFTMLNKSEVPPIEIEDETVANDDLRLEYRYLDLRRPIMQQHLVLRHKAAMAARNVLSKNGFLEIETPLLIRPTPEGARDYIVPSRVNKGHCYSLPQSPQLYKQLLMVSGCDRYFQIAKCLRDEDLRADRQPEFTQIDVEMSFAEEEDIYAIGEKLVQAIVKDATGEDIKIPFPRLTYEKSMQRYGCDKPDLRYDLELTDVTAMVKDCEFSVFRDVASSGGIIKAINPKKNFGRKDLDAYIKFAQEQGAKGLAWMRVTQDRTLDSNIAKYFDDETKQKIIEAIKPHPDSVLMFIADRRQVANAVLDKLRRKLAEDLSLYDKEELRFCWVTDFPLFEWDEDNQEYVAAHHMFTMPKEEHLDYLETDKAKVLAQCYDLTLNGIELASGSIRIHREDIQKRVMRAMKIADEDAQKKFGFLLKAFRFGAPPHGGFAIGFDRLCALLLGMNDIREVIAFPKNKSAQCPMDGSPAEPEAKQLKEIGIQFTSEKKPT